MGLSNDQRSVLNFGIDRYKDTLNKIRMVLRTDTVSFKDKNDIINMLDTAIAKVWIDWTDRQNAKETQP